MSTSTLPAPPAASAADGDDAATPHVIRLRHVQKFYDLGGRKLHVLKGISLDVHAGEYVAVMGPSGSGKSTLLNILGLLDTPDAGSYQLGQRDVGRLPENRLARVRNRHMGFIFQSFNLFPQLDVVGNIEVPMAYRGVARRQRRRRAAMLADRVGLGHRLDHRPAQLSGGEQQRTAIARALANDPPLLLADEPTGNLDEATGLEILALFDELVADGRTLMLVTHNPGYMSRVGRILRMHDGRLEGDTAGAGGGGARSLEARQA